jgi:hypothetical protein
MLDVQSMCEYTRSTQRARARPTAYANLHAQFAKPYAALDLDFSDGPSIGVYLCFCVLAHGLEPRIGS